MTTILNIEGMTCGHCVAAVKRAIESVAGVSSAEVVLEPGQATIEGSPKLSELLAAVEDEGYIATAA